MQLPIAKIDKILRSLPARLPTLSLHQLRNDPLYLNSMYLFLSTLIGAPLGFIYWLIIARLFSPETIGIGTALISAAALLSGLGNLGLGMSVIRYIHHLPQNVGHSLINSCLSVSFVLSFLLGVAYFAGSHIWSPELSSLQYFLPFWFLFPAGVAFTTLKAVLEQILLAHRAGKAVFKANLTMHVIKLVSPFLLIVFGGTVAIYSSFTFAFLIYSVFALWLLSTHFRTSYKFRLQISELIKRKEVVTYALGSHIGSYLVNAPKFIFPLFIVNAIGAAEAALYYIAFTIASILYALFNSISTSALVESSTNLEVTHIKRATKFSLISLIVIVLVLYLAAPVILTIFGETYVDATQVLRILILVAPLSALTRFYIAYCRVRDQVLNMNIFGLLFLLSALFFISQATSLTGVAYAFAQAHIAPLVFASWSIFIKKGK